MEWVKGTIGMNCFWLISSCSSFFCFCLSLLFAFILSFSLWYVFLCVCLIASLFPSLYFEFFSWYLSFDCSCIWFSCSHHAVCLFLCIFQYSLSNVFLLLKVMLSCGIAIFLSSPTTNTFAKTALISFIIFTIFLFELLSVWHGYSAIRTTVVCSFQDRTHQTISLS